MNDSISLGDNPYLHLGLQPVINAKGTVTRLGGSLMPSEVVQAMNAASKHFVVMAELNEAVGRRIAELINVESAAVTTGAAGAITMGTAACVTLGDSTKARRLPDTSGMKNEVILQPSHRMYEAQIRLVGTKLVEVSTPQDLEAAINPNTAMLFFVNCADPSGEIKREEWIAAGKRHGVPTFCDAAADVPPLSRLSEYVNMGFDLVAFSGGKGLRGPQNAGLLLGRKELVNAARMHGEVWNGIGRALKVGKEEVVGLLAAVERFVNLDHNAEKQRYDSRVKVVAEALADVAGVNTEVHVPEIANHVPHLKIGWDTRHISVSAQDVQTQLLEGDPAIEVADYNWMSANLRNKVNLTGVTVGVWTLQDGEEEIVGRRLREVLTMGVG